MLIRTLTTLAPLVFFLEGLYLLFHRSQPLLPNRPVLSSQLTTTCGVTMIVTALLTAVFIPIAPYPLLLLVVVVAILVNLVMTVILVLRLLSTD